jgi:hypothetical protein
MFKRIAISTALAGGLFAGVLGVAGAANANYDAPYYAPYYGPVAGQYDYDYQARCHLPANGSILIGPEGVAFGLPAGGVATVGPNGLAYGHGC